MQKHAALFLVCSLVFGADDTRAEDIVIADRIGDPSSTNGGFSLFSVSHQSGFGWFDWYTTGRVEVGTTARLTRIHGVGVINDDFGAIDPGNDAFVLGVHSTLEGALTNPIYGDVVSNLGLPAPTHFLVGVDYSGMTSRLFSFDLDVDWLRPIILRGGEDYWISIVCVTNYYFHWVESAMPGDSDYFWADGTWILPWTAFPEPYAPAIGRAALKLVGVPAADPALCDLNQDGQIDSIDFQLLAACRSGPAIQRSTVCAAADFDGDNDVDQDDFGVFQRCSP